MNFITQNIKKINMSFDDLIIIISHFLMNLTSIMNISCKTIIHFN